MRTNPTDADLVALANAGDEKGFEAIYYRYRDWSLRVAGRFLRNGSDVDDVVQEAFAYVFDKFPGFELSGTFKGLLYPTIKHLCLSRIRGARQTVTLDELPEALFILESAESPVSLVESLRELSPIHQEILLLRFADDLDLAEIAQSLGVPLGTVKSRLHNAIDALRTLHRNSF